jgi:predicted permease
VRYALRQLIKSPVFTVTSVLTLAIGIGANSAIFGVINAVFLHPAGVNQPTRVAVMKVRHARLGLDFPYVSVPDYADAVSLKEQIEAVAIARPAGFNLSLENTTQRLFGERVSSQWFHVFGAAPILGRTFTAEEDQANAAPVVVLGYGTWQSSFGSDPNILGKKIILDQEPYQVIGVMGQDFIEPKGKQVWVPIGLPPAAFATNQRFDEDYAAVIRLRSGVSLPQMNVALAQKVGAVVHQYSGNSFAAGWSVYAIPFVEFSAGQLATPLRLVFVVVALVLLIAAANVAGLQLARSATRSKDFAIQMALGANSSVLIKQILVESLLMALATVLIGVAVGPVLGKLLILSLPQRIVQGITIHTDLTVLVFTVAAGLAAALIAGVGPALRVTRYGKSLKLNDGSRNTTGSVAIQKLHNTFVISQIALACLLLSATGMFLVSLQHLQQADLGFEPHQMLTAEVVYSGRDFKANPVKQAAFIAGVVNHLTIQPGILSAAAVEPMPFDPDRVESSAFTIENQPSKAAEPGFQSDECYATPGYLAVAKIPLRKGQWFTEEDRADTSPVVVIDEILARKYWPNENPIGQRLKKGDGKPWATVIGVVGSVGNGLLEGPVAKGLRYYPFAQGRDLAVNFVVRSDGNLNGFRPVIKSAVAAFGPEQAITSVTPMEDVISNLLAGRRLIVRMLTVFGGFALFLAVLGIYALTTYLTAQRTAEIGVRMALGAQRLDVIWLILRRTLNWMITGISMGLLLSFIATLVLKHQFAIGDEYGFIAFLLAVFPLLMAGTMAGLVIAWRAAFINPIQAIQYK